MDQSITKPTYEQMVKALFKRMPGHGAAMLHAAVGIAGESGELRCAVDRENILEECGDIEFYIEAAWQQITTVQRTEPFDVVGLAYAEIVDWIHIDACELLDHAKKVWVYEDGNRDEVISHFLRKLEADLTFLYHFLGTTREAVQGLNQAKLMVRYSSGTYSNAQALARADKAEEASGRNFIGKQ